MTVLRIRRYPVKAMGGEGLDAVTLDGRGLVGDRWFAVEDGDGRFASGKDTRRFRRRDRVFDFSAVTGPAGDILVTGPRGTWAVGDATLDLELSRALGQAVRVTAESSIPHQDAGSVSIIGTATLRWCAERWGVNADPRRLRVNIVVATDEPFIEESWAARTLVVGGAALRVVDPVPRCRMIDVDQDGASAAGRWLKPLAAERGMVLAMYADVATPGVVRVGDEVTCT